MNGRNNLLWLVDRAALLAGLYFVLGNIYKQAYLQAFGINLDPVGTLALLIRDVDLFLLFYTVAVWAIFIQTPYNWSASSLNMFNADVWRQNKLINSIVILLFMVAIITIFLFPLFFLKVKIDSFLPIFDSILTEVWRSFYAASICCFIIIALMIYLGKNGIVSRSSFLEIVISQNKRELLIFTELTTILSVLLLVLFVPATMGSLHASYITHVKAKYSNILYLTTTTSVCIEILGVPQTTDEGNKKYTLTDIQLYHLGNIASYDYFINLKEHRENGIQGKYSICRVNPGYIIDMEMGLPIERARPKKHILG